MKVFTCFLAFVFVVSCIAAGVSNAGGGGGCTSSGCENTMYGIAIGTTLLLIGYLYFQKQEAEADADDKADDADLQEIDAIQVQSTCSDRVNPEIVVYRW